MDKEEYHQKLDELTGYVRDKDYKSALNLADEIDWRRVKSINTLNMVADVYEVNKDYERAKEILLLALNRASIGKSILYRLVEVCLKLGQVDEAEKYFKSFSRNAKNDNSRCVLQYKLYKAKHAPLEAQINVLEEYRDKEYTERWAYELALLYSKAGNQKKCVETCDDLILWFSEGKYVLKAMELKKRFEPLSPSQEQTYNELKDSYKKTKPAPSADDRSRTLADASLRASAVAARPVRPAAPVVSDAGRDHAQDLANFKDKFARNFKNIFQVDEEAEAAEDQANENRRTAAQAAAVKPAEEAMKELKADELPEDAEKTEVETTAQKAESLGGEGLKLRELEEEDLSVDVREPGHEKAVQTAAEAAEEIPAAKPVKEINTAEFDLEAFLAETAGSFSTEISDDDYSRQDQTEPAAAEIEEVESLEEEAVNAAVVQTEEEAVEEAEESESETAVNNGLEELNVAAALENAFAEKLDQEEETAEEAAEAVEETETEEKEEAEEAGTVEEGPKVAVNAAAALQGLAVAAAADSSADENAGEPAAAPAEEAPKKKVIHYNEELEIPDPEPTEEEKKSRTHTIPLGMIGQNTVPISIDKILSEETPEERRIRILNKAKPSRMSEEQRKIFTYFARVPGMDGQILEAINGVYQHAGERTSLHGNIAIMGARGTGKSRLAKGLVVAMCKDLGMDAAKVATITGKELNKKDPVKVVSMISGGFLMVEDIADLTEETLEKLNQAMEFRTDCMVMIIEDEKTRLRAFLKAHPQFAAKFEKVISIPVFTNDELVTFARTYATENGCKIDDMAILALYTLIGNIQTEEQPTTISTVRDMIDGAIAHATKGRRRRLRGEDAEKTGKWLILHEKDFSLN